MKMEEGKSLLQFEIQLEKLALLEASSIFKECIKLWNSTDEYIMDIDLTRIVFFAKDTDKNKCAYYWYYSNYNDKKSPQITTPQEQAKAQFLISMNTLLTDIFDGHSKCYPITIMQIAYQLSTQSSVLVFNSGNDDSTSFLKCEVNVANIPIPVELPSTGYEIILSKAEFESFIGVAMIKSSEESTLSVDETGSLVCTAIAEDSLMAVKLKCNEFKCKDEHKHLITVRIKTSQLTKLTVMSKDLSLRLYICDGSELFVEFFNANNKLSIAIPAIQI